MPKAEGGISDSTNFISWGDLIHELGVGFELLGGRLYEKGSNEFHGQRFVGLNIGL